MYKYSFLKKDKLTEEAKQACVILQIDPALLQAKPEEAFLKEGVSKKVAETRHYHYQMKRKQFLDEISDYLRDLSNKGNSKGFMRSKFVSHEIKKAKISSQRSSPYFSTVKPDIPLREPLGEESRRKRQLAKNILDQELKKLVTKNKKDQEDRINRTMKYGSPKRKTKWKLEDNQEKILKQKEKRMQAKIRAEQEAKRRESTILNNFKKHEKRRIESLKKINNSISQQHEVYKNDQRHYLEIRNMSVSNKLEEEKNVQTALEKFDRKMKKFEQNKLKYQQNQLKDRHRRNLISPNVHMNSAIQRVPNLTQKGDTNGDEITQRKKLEQSFKNQIMHKKKRDRHFLEIRRAQQERLAKEHERFKVNIKQRDIDLQHRNQMLMKRIREKSSMISQELQEEQELKRENQRLRKKNLVLNKRRTKALESNYKDQLIDHLLEKKDRAVRARERSQTAGFFNSLSTGVL
ncbi:unnamed protein product [Moneuplotes crassus]|uniref:Uncharacterized protein n=1 Tax=Euplotes crassus TaxID=5936 RepID=A0AAD1XDY1_EUPCR|nr:unnamed protein product [Moneuplotes crassus]